MSDDELERLRRNHAQLTRQVKALLHTEQRLYRVRRALECQLDRIETLNAFALEAARARDETAVGGHAIRALLAMFPYDRGVLYDVEDRALRVVAAAVQRPSDVDKRFGQDADVGTVLPFVGEVPDEPTACAGVASTHACFASPRCPRAPRCDGGAHVVLPLRVGGRRTCMLVASRCDMHHSYVESLPGEADQPFLRLFAHHVESALASVGLRTRLETVLEQLPLAVFVVADDVILDVNAAARRLAAVDAGDELVGRSFRALLPITRPSATTDRAAAVRSIEQRLTRADGTSVVVDVVEVPFRYDERPAVLFIAEDLTERAAMRTQLQQADRLATVGALAAGVAHEINNPLTYVILCLGKVARAVEGTAVEEQAHIALEGAERIRTILKDLKTFGRVGDDRREPVDAERVLDRVLAMAGHELRYRARVVRDYVAAPPVLADEGRLAQAFLNLVVNAAHAIEEGRVQDNELRLSTRVEGDFVVVTIADTGLGIPPEILGRIFDPFFSTKPQGVGAGLGLSISKSIIESCGGRIGVETELGLGTRFFVRLPLARSVADEREPSDPGPPPSRARARVLVVDDEPRVGAAIAEALVAHAVVDVVTSGGEAIARMREGAYGALFFDLMMPELSGMELFDWVEANRPDWRDRVVFVTGGVFTPKGQAFVARVPNLVLEKPIAAEDVLSALVRVLEPDARDGPSVAPESAGP